MTPDRITAEARKIAKEAIYNGGVDWAADDIAKALLAAEQRGREMERATIDAVHDILRADDRYGALAHLPAGGVECEKMVEKAVDLLAAAIRSRTTEG